MFRLVDLPRLDLVQGNVRVLHVTDMIFPQRDLVCGDVVRVQREERGVITQQQWACVSNHIAGTVEAYRVEGQTIG